MASPQSPFYIVAVHGGAGVHSSQTDSQVKRALRLSCKKALSLLQRGQTSLDAIQEAVTFLEVDGCMNAGYGSNLTLTGDVECDASIMCGTTGAFGGVGGVSGVKRPVQLARAVLEYSRRPDPLGRIAPLMLVADGALQFARAQGIPTVPPSDLVAPRAQEEWEHWTNVLRSVSHPEGMEKSTTACPAVVRDDESAPLSMGTDNAGLHNVQDTVGAVACDASGSFSAGVSSGGLLLKHPGRIGEAAIFGAGCWAASSNNEDIGGAACSVSGPRQAVSPFTTVVLISTVGAGEHITRAALARSVVEAVEVPNADTHETIRRILFSGLRGARHGPENGLPHAGLLLLMREQVGEATSVPRLWCAFTTESMAIAYASSMDANPKALILRRPRQQKSEAPIYLAALPLTRE